MRTVRDEGWGRLPRRIARALAGAKLNGSESRVLWAIIYYTFAWNKPEDWITWIQLSEITGIDQWHLGRSINSLLKKGVIFIKGNRYGIQLDFSKWETPPKRVVTKRLPPDQEETPPKREETPPKRVDSLELIPRTDPEKGLSASQRRKKREEFNKGLAMIKEELEKSGKKKK